MLIVRMQQLELVLGNIMSKSGRLAIRLIGGVAAFLLLIGGYFWFMSHRNLEQLTLFRAREQWDQGLYRDAEQTLAGVEILDENGEPIQLLNGETKREGGFLNDFPRSTRRAETYTMLLRIRIEAQIRMKPADWEKGLEALNFFIVVLRDDEDFSYLHAVICEYAKEIAQGAELPATVDQAQKLLDRYTPTSGRGESGEPRADQAADMDVRLLAVMQQ